MYLIAFPLLLVPFALYNMIAFLLGMEFHDVVFRIPTLSGEQLGVSTGDVLVLLGVLMLYVEIVKSTRLADKAVIDHILSLALFVAMVVEFITVKKAATSTFLIITALSFVDVIGGVSITLRTGRREVNIEETGQVTPAH